MYRISRIIVLAFAAVGIFGAGQAVGYAMSAQEQTLRSQLLACAILDEAQQRGVPIRSLPVTRYQCYRLP